MTKTKSHLYDFFPFDVTISCHFLTLFFIYVFFFRFQLPKPHKHYLNYQHNNFGAHKKLSRSVVPLYFGEVGGLAGRPRCFFTDLATIHINGSQMLPHVVYGVFAVEPHSHNGQVIGGECHTLQFLDCMM